MIFFYKESKSEKKKKIFFCVCVGRGGWSGMGGWEWGLEKVNFFTKNPNPKKKKVGGGELE